MNIPRDLVRQIVHVETEREKADAAYEREIASLRAALNAFVNVGVLRQEVVDNWFVEARGEAVEEVS